MTYFYSMFVEQIDDITKEAIQPILQQLENENHNNSPIYFEDLNKSMPVPKDFEEAEKLMYHADSIEGMENNDDATGGDIKIEKTLKPVDKNEKIVTEDKVFHPPLYYLKEENTANRQNMRLSNIDMNMYKTGRSPFAKAAAEEATRKLSLPETGTTAPDAVLDDKKASAESMPILRDRNYSTWKDDDQHSTGATNLREVVDHVVSSALLKKDLEYIMRPNARKRKI